MATADVKNAFLNAAQDKPVYIRPPFGVVVPQGHVLRLKRALYGLRASPKLWNEELTQRLKQLGYQRSSIDPCLYYKPAPQDAKSTMPLALTAVWVDDSLSVAFTDAEEAKMEKDFPSVLNAQVHWVDEKGKRFLGPTIYKLSNNEGYAATQADYAADTLKTFGFENSKPISAPMPTNLKEEDQREQTDGPFHLRSYTGKMLQLSTWTRPDLSYAVNSVARAQTKPTAQAYLDAKHTLRYLKGTVHTGIRFSNEDYGDEKLHITTYVDASHAPDEDRISQTGGVIFLNESPYDWISERQQSGPAISSAEAETVAASELTRWTLALVNILKEIGVPHLKPTICEDNSTVAAFGNERVPLKSKLRHVETRDRFVIFKAEQEAIKVLKVPGHDNIADMLTKRMTPALHIRLRDTFMYEHKPEGTR